MNPVVYTGTSGWTFSFWNKTHLYSPPEGKAIKGAAQLDRYARLLSCVELNASFYRVPSLATVKGWKKKLDGFPPYFKFVIKMNRYATHQKLLLDPESWWEDFWERMSVLGERMGPILFQLPPRFRYTRENLGRLEALEHILPQHHFVFEFRHASWSREHLNDLFQRTGWVVATTHVNNTPARWARRKDPWTQLKSGWNDFDITSSFTYIRLHGTSGQYEGRYSGTHDGEILNQKISAAVARHQPVWVIFNNTDTIDKIDRLRIPSAICDAIQVWRMIRDQIEPAWLTFRKANRHLCAANLQDAFKAFLSLSRICRLSSLVF